ncbi:MAG: FecR domain-containing protein [Gammaproteobacteria bacterium]|nr:FecR domain-containing protein [Gammaproteobacteria bacterium]MDP2139388.1 FecR domain-containing protein [Gammaproteobacteria bacterium]MDP2346224.1 FecR domain-containing protein [Gammaproteobacteria bacterium]
MRTTLLTLMLIVPTLSFAQQTNPPIAKVALSQGESTIITSTGLSSAALYESEIAAGDSLATSATGMLHVRFNNSGIASIRCNSELRIQEFTAEPNEVVELHLLEGSVRIISGTTLPSNFQLVTPLGIVRIVDTGADFAVSADAQASASFGVFQGAISVENESGAVQLGAGNDFNFAVVSDGNPPSAVATHPAGLRSGNCAGGASPFP